MADGGLGMSCYPNIEAWLLADSTMLEKLFQITLPSLPDNLESLPGKKENRNPKNIFEHAIAQTARVSTVDGSVGQNIIQGGISR